MQKNMIYILTTLILVSCNEYLVQPEKTLVLKSETKIDITNNLNQIIYVKNFDIEGNLSSILNYKENKVVAESDFEYNDLNQTEFIYNYENESELIKYSEREDNILSELISDAEGNVLSERVKVFDSNGNLIKIELKIDNVIDITEFDYNFDETGKITSIYIKNDNSSFLKDSIRYEPNKVTRFSYNSSGIIEKQITSEFEDNLIRREVKYNAITEKTSIFIFRYTFW